MATHSIRQFPLHFPLPCVTVCHHISTGLYTSNTTFTTGLQETGWVCGPDLSGWRPVAGCCGYGTEHWACDAGSYWLVVGNEGSPTALCSVQGVIRSAYDNMAAVHAKCHSRVECTTVTAMCCQVKGDRDCVKETAQLSRGRSELALLNSTYFSISTCRWWSSVQNISRTRGNAISIMCSVFNEQDQRTVMGMS